ncbi:MAG TPA: hypothetical protein VME22_07255 [Solirubrobacteraceae bacterium]|nr:hypothetical protein [Solirubrobacteraceae bacterium]
MATPDTPLPPGPPIAQAAAQLAQIRPKGYFGGARLLAADAQVAALLANEARRRTMRRLFGIPVDNSSGLVTLIALGAVVEGVRRQSQRIPSRPTRGQSLIGLGILRETAYEIAGPASRSSRYFGTLLGIALIGGGTRIAVKKSAHGVRVLAHHASADFNHRYGHLIRPNQRRRAA